MNASLWLAAGLACAQLGPPVELLPANPAQDARGQAEIVPPPRPVASKITAVTVYQGQALVTREVSVPEGDGTVELVKTSAELSTDALYQRTARMDNLLRWDVDLPQGTVGDKTMYLNYEFHLEYSRTLPQPRFVSGGLREGPIGGGAIGGGMGGMGGGMRSVNPR